jgi:hypothetical protein
MPSSAPVHPGACRGRLSRPLPLLDVFFLLIAADFPYHYAFRFFPLAESLSTTLLEASACTLILWGATRLDLARVTACFLALPYLIFIPGWLNLPTAMVLTGIFIFGLLRTLRSVQSVRQPVVTVNDLVTFVGLMVLVNLSGAGGYGHQTPDYGIHNARLSDLVQYRWPVHYGVDQNFISYFGYFLPSAFLGKFSNMEIAAHSMYLWTLLGMTLVLRWLSVLGGWKFSVLLVFVFILFGPADILNILLLGYRDNIPFSSAFAEAMVNTDYVDFRIRYDIGFIIGNYLSNAFQLFWSPHQVIAGWLAISLATCFFLQRQTKELVFVYALICLWSPLTMIALFPFVLVAVILSWLEGNWRDVFSIENTLCAGSLTLVFIIFYLGGNSGTIPSQFILSGFDWANKGWVLALFYFSAWGAYVLALTPFIAQQASREKIWFGVLAGICLVLPLNKFGAYSDLLCRGSAPLMFLLLIFVLQGIRHYWQHKQYVLLVSLFILMMLGSGSALLQVRNAIFHYGERPETGNIIEYTKAHPDENENLGPDDSVFNRYLRRNP